MDYDSLAESLGGSVDYDAIANSIDGSIKQEEQPKTRISQEEETEKNPPWYAGVVERTGKRFGEVQRMIERNAPSGEKSPLSAAVETVWESPKTLALAATKLAGTIPDTAFSAITEGVSKVIPDWMKDWGKEEIQGVVESPVGQVGLQAMQYGGSKWKNFKKDYPDAAMALEGIANFYGAEYTVTGVKKAATGTLKETVNLVSDIKRTTGKTFPQRIDNLIQQDIRPRFEKAIKPQLAKFSPSHKEKYMRKMQSGVEDIIENKDKLKLVNKYNETVTGKIPESVDEWAQAIQQLEKDIFTKMNAIATGAEGKISTDSIVRHLRLFAKQDAIKAHGKTIGRYALKTANELEELGSMTPLQAQRRIALLNQKLKTHYRAPSAVTQGKSMVEEIIVDDYRKLLARHMENLTGDKYSSLRQRYSALRAIQDDVNRAANRVANAPQKDFLDIGTDIFATHQAVAALTRADAPLLFAAATARTTKDVAKYLKDSDRAVKKIFSNTEKLYRNKKAFSPKSVTFKYLRNTGE